MKKKLAILLVGTMIASSILAGCGSKKSEPTKKETVVGVAILGGILVLVMLAHGILASVAGEEQFQLLQVALHHLVGVSLVAYLHEV